MTHQEVRHRIVRPLHLRRPDKCHEEGSLFAPLLEDQKEEGGIFLRRYITHYKKVHEHS